MTTGSYTNGGLSLYGLLSSKTWTGTDGRTVGSPAQVKWNAYSMRHRTSRISGAMLLHATSWTQVVRYANNGTYNATFSDPTYDSWLHDGNNPVWTAATAASKFTSLWTSQKEYELLSKLLRNIKGHQFNIGVSLAEVDKFGGTVLGTIKNITFGVVDLSRGRYAKFARRFGASPPSKNRVRKLTRKDVSGRFLEMRYAWAPAVQDIYEASKAFEEISRNRRGKRFTASSSVTQVLSKTDGTYFRKWPDRITKAGRKYIFEMYEPMSAIRQMGLYNPASIIWERIPWSFVIDWFIPIGTYLELVGQIPGLSGRFLRTDYVRSSVVGSLSNPIVTPGYYYLNSGDVATENFYIIRSVSSSLTVPRPDIRVSGAVQGKRVQNAIALSHQIFEKILDRGSRSKTPGARIPRKWLSALGQL
jgi:hypothetical protein